MATMEKPEPVISTRLLSVRHSNPPPHSATKDYWDNREMTMELPAAPDSYPDADDMVAYLQASAEKTSARLARELHDEMGGLLVSAVMDVAFAEQALAVEDRLRQRLARARGTLAAAIDLKRRTSESLRPSILDNFGLFEAIRWEVKQESRRTHIPCSEIYPNARPEFSREAAIMLFRILQDALAVALRQPMVKAVHVALDIEADTLRITVKHDGATADHRLTKDDNFALCSVAHRVRGLGGRMAITAVAAGGTQYSATLSLARLTELPKSVAPVSANVPAG